MVTYAVITLDLDASSITLAASFSSMALANFFLFPTTPYLLPFPPAAIPPSSRAAYYPLIDTHNLGALCRLICVVTAYSRQEQLGNANFVTDNIMIPMTSCSSFNVSGVHLKHAVVLTSSHSDQVVRQAPLELHSSDFRPIGIAHGCANESKEHTKMPLSFWSGSQRAALRRSPTTVGVAMLGLQHAGDGIP
jgi:hypothetical protein